MKNEIEKSRLVRREARFRVLAAGDCAAVLPLVAEASTGLSFELQPFATTGEVVARLDDYAPDLIFVDADCPQPDALELCKALKEHPATMLLPVIVVSRSSKMRIEAFSAGADDFITRQIPREVLITRLESLARQSSVRRKAAGEALQAEVTRREEIRRTFRRYVSPQLADRILGNSELRDSILASSDIRTRAVVLFADLRGFTGISERLSPHEVVPLLNEYFSLLVEITFHHEGTVFHMAGDCLMVGFGVPLEQSDSSARAVLAAQEMLERFSGLAESWRQRHQIETGLGIGINEGEVVAGNVGSAVFMNYTLIGDAVNIASRLCQRARAGEMVFSGTIKRSLDAKGLALHAIELPPMTLRGRSSQIDIYCVPLDKRLDIGEAPALAPLSR
ncbi:MAG TPA: adenylate/guanylate cyclase domain-containing protein [Steroidobacteraceae bacterium]|nr:adenylate/guanylate cyclase domain-containing protein [Steroidobacteraceae bacterium]